MVLIELQNRQLLVTLYTHADREQSKFSGVITSIEADLVKSMVISHIVSTYEAEEESFGAMRAYDCNPIYILN